VIGDREEITQLPLEAMAGVDRVVAILKPYKLVSREFQPRDTVVDVRGVKVGGDHFVLIAGPCSVETPEQVMAAARAVKEAGGHMMRGGAFKPRTSPYAFQGLGEDGLKMLADARDATGLPIVTEVMDPRDLDVVLSYADVLQVGARNTQNFLLLAELGKAGKPVLLKRGPSTTVEELLMAAEYIVKEGNRDVILCERGIRTFETATRNTLDVSAVPLIKIASHLPVVVDPSHSAGRLDLVLPLSLAGVAAGADGVLVETHPTPEHALCDGPQALPTAAFGEYAARVLDLARWAGKTA
jgi:3-deoxy-7-phosphoheptulonate synthase